MADVWTEILRGASHIKAPPSKHMLLLGDLDEAKKTLHKVLGAQACGLQTPAAFSWAELVDDEDELLGRLSVISVSEAAMHGDILDTLVQRLSVSDLSAALVLDWRDPDGFLQTLDKWLCALQALADRRLASMPGFADAQQSVLDYGATNGARDAAGLAHNLGIPVFIVMTNSDAIHSQLQVAAKMPEELLDNIQQLVRSIALPYGAAVIHVSQLSEKTGACLRNYVAHRVLWEASRNVLPLKDEAQIVNRETVFVPSGWDTVGKIRVLCDTFDPRAVVDADGPIQPAARAEYEERIGLYARAKQTTGVARARVMAEDEQAFLEKQAAVLAQIDAGSPKRRVAADARVSANASPISKIISESPRNVPAAVSSSAPTLPNSGGDAQTEVLANFFQSLLNKKGAAGSGSGTPTRTHEPEKGDIAAQLERMKRSLQK